MLSTRSTVSGLVLSLLVLFQPFATSHSAGVGDVVPGMVVLRFTVAANPPLTVIQLSPAEFGISTIDAVLASIPSAELQPFMPDRHSDPSPARDRLERTYILRFAEEANPDTIAALLTPFSEFEQVRVETYARACYFGTKRHIPPDTEFSPYSEFVEYQWNLDSHEDDRQDIDAPEAWEIERGDPSVVWSSSDSMDTKLRV